MDKLIARLEKATGPDRELDRDIYEFAKGGCTERANHDVIAGFPFPPIDAGLTLCSVRLELFGQ